MAIADTNDGAGLNVPPVNDASGVGDVQGNDGGGDSSGFGDHIIIDPTTIGASTAKDGDGSSGSRKRGRPKGSRNNRGTNKAASLDLNGVAATLFSLHMMGAALLSAPKLRIDDGEAKLLAGAIKNVERHYDTGITEKTMDWMNLFGVVGMIYGPRIFASRAEKAKAKEEAKAANGADPAASPFIHQPAYMGAQNVN